VSVLSAKLKLSKTETPNESLIQNAPKLSHTVSAAHFQSKNNKAGFLIDQCGLKGLKIGGAQISKACELLRKHKQNNSKDVSRSLGKRKKQSTRSSK
jgi:UDP-N-acetylenolpyruvoylglucosamine reductase